MLIMPLFIYFLDGIIMEINKWDKDFSMNYHFWCLSVHDRISEQYSLWGNNKTGILIISNPL